MYNMDSIILLFYALQACSMCVQYSVALRPYWSSIIAYLVALRPYVIVEYLVALRPYLSATGEAVVLPSCGIPHSNKLSFVIVEAVFHACYVTWVLSSFVVVILVPLYFMKPTVINTLVCATCRSPRLAQCKNPLEFKSNSRLKGGVTLFLRLFF
jgi:hypothetical protein